MQTRHSVPPAFYRDSSPPPPSPDDPHRCEWPGEDEGGAGALKDDPAYLGRIYGVPVLVLALCALVAVFFFLAFQHGPL